MHNPNFSSGPCSKRPDWSLDTLKNALVGRSHRSAPGKARLAEAITRSKKLLGIPDDYILGIFPGSDTGAFEAAMWTMLGPKPITVLVWESFSQGWATDIEKQLKLKPRVLKAGYGELPPLDSIDWSGDVVFVANGTTSGVKIPNWDWVPADREGLSMCDATSAVFAMDIDWSKIDVLTYSWQKCLGGEAAHGVMVMSPRAMKRIETYDPPWPLPKVFRMKKNGKVDKAIFDGDTINTPSMLCVEDYIDALNWAEHLGLQGLISHSRMNLKIVEGWVARTDWIEFLARTPETRSNTSVCLSVVSEKFKALSTDAQSAFLKGISSELSKKGIAHDINSYKDAPPGYRFWCGPTIDPESLRKALSALEETYLKKVQEI
jgi:phosphoserine aminotransferase